MLTKFQLLEMEYKFWETQEDKEERIKRIWIDLKRKNALGGLDQRTSGEQIELNKEITELTRKIRWRVDQELTRRSIEPIFKENYYTYDKDEFLIDADFEFVKIKNLLSKSPKLLKEDPILSIDYLKIINLIKQKKLLENTTDQYDPTSAVEAHHYDVDKNDRIIALREEEGREHFAKNFEEAESDVSKGIEDYDKGLETKIKNDKKAQAREQLKIIKQFDTLADQFQGTTK